MNRRYITCVDIVLKVTMSVLLFAMISYLSLRHYRTFDFTASNLYSLTYKTENILKAVEKDIVIKVFFQEVHMIYDDLRSVLDLYSQASDHITIEYIDPDKDMAKFKQISAKYKIDTMATLIVESGDSLKYLTESDLAQISPGDVSGKQVSYISGLKIESSVSAAILNVMTAKRKKVYFTKGHGEKDITDTEQEGLATLAKRIAQDNYDVVSLSAGGDAIPADCDVLFIAGPSTDFTDDELSAISVFISQGGSLFVAIDPLMQTNLNLFLKDYGISVGKNIVVDPAKRVSGRSAANVYIDVYGEHIITKMLNNVAVLFYLVSSVDVSPDVDLNNLKVTPLLFTSEHGWGETDTANNKFSKDENVDIVGSVSVAAVCEEKKLNGYKLALFGDSDFMAEGNISAVGNSDIVLNTVNWLTDNESLIAATVKPKEQVFLTLTAKDLSKIFFMVLVFIPFVFFVAGVVVWFARRK